LESVGVYQFQRQHNRQDSRDGLNRFTSRIVTAVLVVVLAGSAMPVLGQPGTVPLGQPQAQPVQPGAVPMQPGAQPDAGDTSPSKSGTTPTSITNEDGEITLSVFSDPVDLTTLIDIVVKTLNINVTIKGALTGNVTFNAPVSISKDKLMPLVDALLEQQNYTIHLDKDSGFYVVEPISDVGPVLGGDRPSTRIIPTPGIRPSALRSAVDSQFGGGGGGGAPGQPQGAGGGGGGAAGNLAYLDEMGVIVATGTQRRLEAVQSLVERLMQEYHKAKFRRFDLKYVAAPVARERALQLVGQASPTRNRSNNPDNPQPEQAMPNPGGGAASGRANFDNIAERLTVDPQGNALMFRGVDDEIDRVTEILELIDVRSDLLPKKYVVGNAAQQIADIAKQRGLGDITTIEDTSSNNNRRNNFYDPYNNPRRSQSTTTSTGGPVMVVDEKTGTIIYYGTEEQQKQLARLVEELQLDSDKVTVRTYKLRHAKAEEVSEIILGLLQNRQPAGRSSLTSGAGSNSGTGNNSRNNRNSNSNTNTSQPVIVNNPGFFDPNSQGGSSEGEFAAGPDTFVLADTLNNQVLVKAPTRQQAEFERIIQKLDLRRPQVYIDAQIVAVTWTDDMRLAFETQFTNIGDFGGVLNTNFGLGTFGTGAGINGTKTVSNSSGLTAALIKADQVPIIINALQQKVNTRILSSPKLLVDDNEEAELKSKNEQPTTTSTQGTSTTNTSFGGYEEAGTNLKVTPRISDAGYVGLQVTAELSSFSGRTNNGIPPARDTNTLTTNSVSVPTDMTVVIGGLQFDSKTNDRSGIPFFMDIPGIGALFRDDNDSSRKTTLYIFLTPRVIRDPGSEDIRLLTQGPRSASDLPPDLPPIVPQPVEIIAPMGLTPPTPAPETSSLSPTPNVEPAMSDKPAAETTPDPTK